MHYVIRNTCPPPSIQISPPRWPPQTAAARNAPGAFISILTYSARYSPLNDAVLHISSLYLLRDVLSLAILSGIFLLNFTYLLIWLCYLLAYLLCLYVVDLKCYLELPSKSIGLLSVRNRVKQLGWKTCSISRRVASFSIIYVTRKEVASLMSSDGFLYYSNADIYIVYSSNCLLFVCV